MGVSWADNSIQIWRNLPISNPKPDLHNINAIPNLVKIHWCLLKLSSGNEIRTDEHIWNHGAQTKKNCNGGTTLEWSVEKNYCGGFQAMANTYFSVSSNIYSTWWDNNFAVCDLFSYLGLRPFQEYFTCIEPVIHQRWEKTPDHSSAELGFPICDPCEALTTMERNLMD